MHFDIAPMPEQPNAPRSWRDAISGGPRSLRYAALSCTGIAVVLVAWLTLPPRTFPTNSVVTISTDVSAGEFGQTLAAQHVISSPLVFKILARVSGYDRHLDPGGYEFKQPLSVFSVLWRIGHAEHGIEPIKVTLTEGMTRADMAATLQEQLPGFDSATFLRDSSTSEGYLFPDTYLFMPGDSGETIVTRLTTQFNENIASITPEIQTSGHSLKDEVIIASILEREARGEQDKRIVAGILWNRIAHHMPLQVDAVFGYIHQQNGYTPTAADLEMDSPYNTYKYAGLPPTPISNPGLESLLAAIKPVKTPYFYYLTGKDGKMHYAVTFEQHKKNRALYLD